MKISDYVVSFLEDCGVKDVFMLSGGGAMHLNDSIGNSNKVKYTCCLHEQACVFAAESYARSTNTLGVTIVTTGPGATNVVTGIAASWIESTSLFVISGQVKRADLMTGTGVRQMGVQEVDIVSIVKPITKYAVMITDPQMIRYELEKCIFLAKNGRPGPVLLDIPLDIQASRVDVSSLDGYTPEISSSDLYYNIEDDIEAVGKLLQSAKRPVIYAGAGVSLSGAKEEFLSLIDKLNIPVVTTWNGMDLIWEDHPMYVGRPGAIGQRAANFVIQNSDLLLTIGTRLSFLQTGFNFQSYAEKAKLIMVDIDPAELDKKYLHLHMKIKSDAKYFIDKLLGSDVILNDYSDWIRQCKKWNERYPILNPNWNIGEEYANSYYLVDEISSQMQSEDIYCGGRAGTCIDTIIHAFKVKKGQQVLATKGLSSMGYGLPAAIGAAIANPDKRIVCINGDGGVVMNIQELETVRRLNLPIKLFVLDNSGYATIVATQTNVFDKNFVACDNSTGVTLGDFVKIGEAYGIKTFEINNNSEIKNIVKECLAYNGPVLCNVKVSLMQPIEPRQASYKDENGQMKSRPLNDMKPFLSEEEIESNTLN